MHVNASRELTFDPCNPPPDVIEWWGGGWDNFHGLPGVGMLPRNVITHLSHRWIRPPPTMGGALLTLTEYVGRQERRSGGMGECGNERMDDQTNE